MSSLSLAPTIEIFPCPTCSQTINTSMTTCPFCGTPVDTTAAASAADNFARVNRSISDASYLKIMAGCAVTFFVVMFVPFLGLLGLFGFRFLEIAVPFMAIRWWVKYRTLISPDPEFRRARKIAVYVGIGSVLFDLLFNAGPFRR
jgi:hypothetical protein